MQLRELERKVPMVGLDERQEHFLAAVVDSYVRSASPVGSRALTRTPGVSLSAASIRSIMAGLEVAGCVYRPHHSAGRVPTDLGYRYYVDRLMPLRPLEGRERDRLAEAMTGARWRAIEGVEVLVRRLAGFTRQLTVIADAGGAGFQVQFAGTRHILAQPEFDQSQCLVPIFDLLDESTTLGRVLTEVTEEDRIVVRIGHENPLEAFRACAVIGVRLSRSPARVLAVVGPTRMDYASMVSRFTVLHEIVRAS